MGTPFFLFLTRNETQITSYILPFIGGSRNCRTEPTGKWCRGGRARPADGDG